MTLRVKRRLRALWMRLRDRARSVLTRVLHRDAKVKRVAKPEGPHDSRERSVTRESGSLGIGAAANADEDGLRGATTPGGLEPASNATPPGRMLDGPPIPIATPPNPLEAREDDPETPRCGRALTALSGPARTGFATHELTCFCKLQVSWHKRSETGRDGVEIPSDYVPMAESRDLLFQLHLASFEGPLDLLLFLIRRHKIDIFDIPMRFICAEYLRSIRMMEAFDVDVAGEFLFMASELLHIKSKVLLPKPAEVDDEDEGDPRAELVARLLEYQKYKGAAEDLERTEWLGRDRFRRPSETIASSSAASPLKEVGVFALIDAFNRVLERQKPEVRHRVLLEQLSVYQRMRQLVQELADVESAPFERLVAGLARRLEVIVTFLAVLEMAKRALLRVYISQNDTLYLCGRFDDVNQALSELDGLSEDEYA